MTREEFCKTIVDIRQKSPVKMKDICAQLDTLPTSIYRFEKGEHNFSLQKVMDYLHVLNAEIALTLDGKTTRCKNYGQLIKWLINARTGKFSQRQLADAVGISHVMVARVETKKSNLTIDVFLKIIELLGGQMAIHNNN